MQVGSDTTDIKNNKSYTSIKCMKRIFFFLYDYFCMKCTTCPPILLKDLMYSVVFSDIVHLGLFCRCKLSGWIVSLHSWYLGHIKGWNIFLSSLILNLSVCLTDRKCPVVYIVLLNLMEAQNRNQFFWTSSTDELLGYYQL